MITSCCCTRHGLGTSSRSVRAGIQRLHALQRNKGTNALALLLQVVSKAAPELVPGGDCTHEARHPGALAGLHPVRLPRQVRGGLPLPRQQELVRAAAPQQITLFQAPLVFRELVRVRHTALHHSGPDTSCVCLDGLPRLPACLAAAALLQWAGAQHIGMSVQWYPASHAAVRCCRCEKFCACGPACAIRYQGCDCKASSSRCTTKRCPCFAAGAPCPWAHQHICQLLGDVKATAQS
jgi:hypothetical protein